MNDYTYDDHRNDDVLAARLADAADMTATAEISTRELLHLASDILDNVATFEASMGVTDVAMSLWHLRRILDSERAIIMGKSAPITLN